MTTSDGPFPPDDALSNELTDTELDAALGAADAQLLDHVRAHANPVVALSALLGGTSTDAQDRAAPLSDGAATQIRARTQAHTLERDLHRASLGVGILAALLDPDPAFSRTVDLNDLRARTHDVARVLTRAVGRAGDLARALDLARHRHSGAARTIATLLIQVRDGARTLTGDLDHVVDLDCGDARDLDSAAAQASHLVRDLDGACGRARSLAHNLAAQPVNASGADLSEVSLPDLAVLEGVVWDEFTRWQPGLRDRIADRSEEIAAGVYQVRSGTARDPHTAPGR